MTSSYVTVVSQPNEAGIHDIMADATESLSIHYVQGNLVVQSSLMEAHLQVRIANLSGQSVMTLPVQLNSGYADISVEQLPTGVFIATVTDRQGHKATCKFIKQ
jgi:hypothetical protein